MSEQFLQRASAGAAGSVSEARILRISVMACPTDNLNSGVKATPRRRREEKW